MKTMKRIMALALALLLTLALAVTASAEETTGSITINNTMESATYRFYKMLEVEKVSDTEYLYKPVEKWENFFSAAYPSAGGTYNKDTGYIVWTNTNLFDQTNATNHKNAIAAMTVAAQQYVNANTITPTKTVASTGASVTADGLDVGYYYLIDSSLGSEAIAGPVKSTAETVMEEKNPVGEVPTITKKVGAEYTGDVSAINADSYGVQFGDTFSFKVTITINHAVDPATNAFVLTDTLPEYISVDANSFQIIHTSGDEDKQLTKGSDYTVNDAYTLVDTNTHTIIFNKDFAKGDVLTVIYNAALVKDSTGNLPVAMDLYTNRATITCDDTSVYDTASVYTLALEGEKFYTNDTGAKVPLNGAEFVLKNSDGKFYKAGDTTGAVTWVDEQTDATTVTSAEMAIGSGKAHGRFEFFGLAEGEYTLVETNAPDGYKGAGETKVTLSYNNMTVSVENIPATAELPATGGIGTTVFYAVGGILVLAAVAVLLNRKRSAKD